MNREQGYVRDFHDKYHFTVNTRPTLLPSRTWRIRHKGLVEEVKELKQAEKAKDLIKIADALTDILYIAYGTANSHGIDIEEIFAEVHRSNMTKDPPIIPDSKALKGVNYSPPNLEPILVKMGWKVSTKVVRGYYGESGSMSTRHAALGSGGAEDDGHTGVSGTDPSHHEDPATR